MYWVKKSGKGCWEAFYPTESAEALGYRELGHNLGRSVEREELRDDGANGRSIRG